MSDYVWITEDEQGNELVFGQKYAVVSYFRRDADHAPTSVTRYRVNATDAEPKDVTDQILAEIGL